MRYLTIRHVGITILLFVYFAAVFYLVPIFALGLLEPGIGNKATHFAITYAIATFSTYFTRLFYVTDVSFRFELAAGLAVAFVFFVLIGQPRLKRVDPDIAVQPGGAITVSPQLPAELPGR
jgi:hypothetical protein